MKTPIGHSKEQRAKRDRSAFAALRASPVTGDITFPANARVYARSPAGKTAGSTAATFNGRTIQTPVLPAGGSMFVGYIERGTVLTPGAGMEILIDMGLGRVAKIGEGA